MTLDKYEILSNIASGSYGEVYRGIDRQTNEPVAVKVPLYPTDPKAQTSWNREHEVLKQLSSPKKHPSILQLNDFFHDQVAGPVLVTEFCKGGDLLRYILARGRLSEDETRTIFSQLVDAVEYMHNNSIVHRDLKLENVFIRNPLPQVTDPKQQLYSAPQVVIGDWGFATKWAPGKLLSEWCGSFHYACPEMFLETPYVGPEVDVWSLGVVLYGLAAGYLPFDVEPGQDNSILETYITVANYDLYGPKFSPLLTDLIKRILQVHGPKRLTIQQIKNHPWMTLHKDFSIVKEKFALSPSVNSPKASPRSSPVEPSPLDCKKGTSFTTTITSSSSSSSSSCSYSSSFERDRTCSISSVEEFEQQQQQLKQEQQQPKQEQKQEQQRLSRQEYQVQEVQKTFAKVNLLEEKSNSKVQTNVTATTVSSTPTTKRRRETTRTNYNQNKVRSLINLVGALFGTETKST